MRTIQLTEDEAYETHPDNLRRLARWLKIDGADTLDRHLLVSELIARGYVKDPYPSMY